MSVTRIVIADDHLILLDGLRAMLERQDNIEVLATYESGQALLDELVKLKPQLAIVDINMPGMQGGELTRKIKELDPSVYVITLSMYDDASHIMEMIDAGVSGYLLKNVNDRELIDAISQVMAGKMYFSSEVSEKLTMVVMQQQRKLEEPAKPKLTERELEILKLIANEHSNAEIAEILFISERTVETHRKNMLRKTNNKTIVGLLKFAMEQNLL